MQNILSYFQQHWAWIAGTGGALAAIAVFVKECLTIAKLRREISILKQQSADRKTRTDAIIVTPSAEELYRYAIQTGFIKQVQPARWRGREMMSANPSFLVLLASFILVGSFTALGDSSWPLLWRAGVALLLTAVTYLLCRALLDRFTLRDSARYQLEKDIIELYRCEKAETCTHPDSISFRD
jgi:hypothetical protein